VPILVDTGAVELLRRRDRRAETLVLRHYPPIICTHVIGEFLFGQSHAKVSAATYQEAREFLDSFEILRPGMDTAMIYSRLRAQLQFAGIQLPDPDYWIAAHAIEGRIRLLSTDKDFERIPGLELHHLPAK
jgi:predicted nucleic acid-binding protein